MRTRGFTIVELLIVIVVIAILAAITIVAYNGIRERSVNSQMVSAVSTYVRAIQAYNAQNSQLPMTASTVQCFDGVACWSGHDAMATQNLRANLLTMVSSLPTVPAGRGALITQASTADTPNSVTYSGWYILYEVTGSECPAIGGTRYLNYSNNGSLRSCRAALL